MSSYFKKFRTITLAVCLTIFTFALAFTAKPFIKAEADGTAAVVHDFEEFQTAYNDPEVSVIEIAGSFAAQDLEDLTRALAITGAADYT
jgi:hypothetical protein